MKAVKEKQQMRGHSRHGCSTTHGHTLKMERCFAIFVANRRRQIHLDQQAAQISEHQLFRGTKDCKDHQDALHEEVMRDRFNNQQRRFMREQSHAIITAMKAVY